MTENKTDGWISVDDKLPTNKTFKKFHVKARFQFMNYVEETESIALGKMYDGGFRFCESDWMKITHYMEFE